MDNTYLWLDLETTGLSPTDDRILQVAWGFTDERFRELTEVKSRVVTIDRETWDLIKANPFVQDMHSKTGLLEKLTGEGTLILSDIEEEIIADILKIRRGAPTLAGASVHFDQSFLSVHMTRLTDHLHYRIFDTSTLQAFFRDALGYEHGIENPNQHDAEQDILYCIEVARTYMWIVERVRGGSIASRAEGEPLV